MFADENEPQQIIHNENKNSSVMENPINNLEMQFY